MVLNLDQIEAGLCGAMDLIRAARTTEGDTQKAILTACSMMVQEVLKGFAPEPTEIIVEEDE